MDMFTKPYELENQFLLRLPNEQAEKLKEILLAGNLRDRVSIDVNNDLRHGNVKIDGEKMTAKLVDLPCIIESLKTLDMKTFYKTADIAQMLICSIETEPEADQKESKSRSYKEKKFLYPHGITPPLKNVRRRRFRKTARKKYIESPDIEKEVKRLLKADMEAESIEYEIVAEEEKQDPKDNAPPGKKDIDVTDHDELHKIFQDLSSSESEQEKDDDFDESMDFDSSELPSNVLVVTDKDERNKLELRAEQLLSELAELRKRKQRKEILIKGENIRNEMLKMRFQGELEELTVRITETRQEYLLTLAMLGRNK